MYIENPENNGGFQLPTSLPQTGGLPYRISGWGLDHHRRHLHLGCRWGKHDGFQVEDLFLEGQRSDRKTGFFSQAKC